MLVNEVMNTDVKTIEPSATAMDAAKAMHELSMGCLVVIKDEIKLAGIITDSDIIGKVVAEDLKASEVKISKIMSKKLIVIEDSEDITKAAEVMEKARVKKLPVVSGDSLVGILTVSDLAQAQPKLIKQVSDLMTLPKTKKNVAG